MNTMSTVSQAIRTCLFAGVPLLILWNILALVMIIAQRLSLKRMRKFCENENVLKTNGTVNQLVKVDAVDTSPSYYSSYLFYTASGEAFTGRYGIEKTEDYKEGLSVTVFYDKNTPDQNICINELAHTEKLISAYYRLIPYGTLFILGILLLIFFSQLIF